MNTLELEKLKYPIGKYEWATNLNKTTINDHITTLERFPSVLKSTLSNIDKVMFERIYRPKGWTIAQVIHHLADSHCHSYLRFKLSIYEDTPAIKDYNEGVWANILDAKSTDIKNSLLLIEGIHGRWIEFLKLLKINDFKRQYFHPERNKYYPLETALGLYSWHCNHHLQHIKNALLNSF
jgi:hypothetical protein